MSVIYFKYSNDNWATESSVLGFNATKLYTEPERVSLKGRTLRDRLVTHTISTRVKAVYTITISADELFATKFNNLTDIYLAKAWKISENNSTWIEVDLVNDGKLPIDYIRNHRKLRKVTLEFIKKDPD
jgi:hypothetical protein